MQQPVRSVTNLPEYNKVFRKHIIPIDPPDQHHYYNANNISYVDNLSDISSEIIVVDSQARNWDKEDSNNYTVFLGQTFNYVHSLELVDGYVPASGYIINTNNNLLCFQEEEDDGLTNVYVEPGNYDIKSLMKTISTGMNEASPNHYTYKCNADLITNKVKISSDHHFSLIFEDGTEVVGERGTMDTLVVNPLTNRKELQRVEVSDNRRKYLHNSIGKILGFKPLNLTHERHYTGQMVYDLIPYKYLAIFVNTENDSSFGNIIAPSPDNGVNHSFAIVPLINNCYSVNKFKQVIDNGHFSLSFNPPIHFNKIKISFRTIDGQLYDFNGVDHYLVFEVKRAFNKEIVKSLRNLT